VWPSVPNEDALSEYPLVSIFNRGSYSLGEAGWLSAENIGFAMKMRSTFTLEGWLLWSDVTGESDIAVAGDVSTGEGVRVYASRDGERILLGVCAREQWPGSYLASGKFDFDMSAYSGKWVHVAVVYNPWDGKGKWSLLVEGRKDGGTIENFYRPTAESFFRKGSFCLGSSARTFNCMFDMWRISGVVCSTEDLLWHALPGLLLLFR